MFIFIYILYIHTCNHYIIYIYSIFLYHIYIEIIYHIFLCIIYIDIVSSILVTNPGVKVAVGNSKSLKKMMVCWRWLRYHKLDVCYVISYSDLWFWLLKSLTCLCDVPADYYIQILCWHCWLNINRWVTWEKDLEGLCRKDETVLDAKPATPVPNGSDVRLPATVVDATAVAEASRFWEGPLWIRIDI